MARVAFKNILDEKAEFIEIEQEYLLPCIYGYARLQVDDLYTIIMTDKVSILLNGEILHPDDWGVYKVLPEDEITIVPILEGGNIGAIISTVVGSVLMAVGYFFPAVFPVGWATYAMGAGLALALGGISSILFSPTLPQFGNSGSQSYNWNTIQTTATINSPIPVVYGTHAVGGNIISMFTQVEGEDNYLYMLLALCEGEIAGICQKDDLDSICQTSDQNATEYEIPAIKLDDQWISNYTGVEWWYRTGTNLSDATKGQYNPFVQNQIPYFEGSSVQYEDGRDIADASLNTTIYTTSDIVDMVTITIYCPALFDATGENVRWLGVGYNIFFRKYGESAWIQYADVNNDFYRSEFGSYEMEGCFKSGKRQATTIDFRNAPSASGTAKYDILVHRKGAESNHIKISDKLTLESVVEKIQGSFIYPNTALLGLKIRATGQLSGSPPSVVTIVKGMKVEVPSTSTSLYALKTYSGNYVTTTGGGGSTVYCGSNSVDRYELFEFVDNGDGTISLKTIDGYYLIASGVYGLIGATTQSVTSASKFTEGDLGGGYISLKSSYNNLYVAAEDGGGDGKSLFAITGSVSTYETFEKVECPAFYRKYYNATTGYYELGNGGSTSTWDSETYHTTKEWSNNAMLCVRDLLLSNRYGLGQYITSSDLYDAGIAEVVGECHTYYSITDNQYHTWDGVLESEQSALTILVEMCSSFRCWPLWYSGKFSFIIDKDDTPVHTLSMGNISAFSQTFIPLSEIPYKVTGQFTDVNHSYEMRNIVAKSTDTTLNKLTEKTVGLKGIVEVEKAIRETIWKLNKATNCTHIISGKCSMDYMHGTAGDVLNIQHTLPGWGHGGRILDYNSTNASITIDSEYGFTIPPTEASYLIKFQRDNGEFHTATVNLSATGSYQTFAVRSWSATPCEDSVYALGVSTSYVKPFRVMSAQRSAENEVEFSAIEHLPTLYTEQAIVTIEDNYSDLQNPYAIPSPPINVIVTSTDSMTGVGFEIKADPPVGDYQVIEIAVTMAEEANTDYKTIAIIPRERRSTIYIDNSLMMDHTYYFALYSRTKYKNSTASTTTCVLEKKNFKPPKPTGIRIKGNNPNVSVFNSTDLSITWNPIANNIYTSTPISGYRVEIYKNSESQDNFLRSMFVKNEEATYTLADNLSDGPSHSAAYRTLVFSIYTITVNGVESDPAYFTAVNGTPSAITGIRGSPTIGGVQFEWDRSPDQDHKGYKYKVKVGASGTWDTTWKNITDNKLAVVMTPGEISSFSSTATIVTHILDEDYYLQYSASVEASVKAGTISDNIFGIYITSSGGSGTLLDLIDGNRSTGGITF